VGSSFGVEVEVVVVVVVVVVVGHSSGTVMLASMPPLSLSTKVAVALAGDAE
jgi:hypothetical protein